MRQRQKRRFYTAGESAEIWDRWRRGQGLWTIARAFGKTSSSIFAHISPTGGIRPPPRRRPDASVTRRRPSAARSGRSPAIQLCQSGTLPEAVRNHVTPITQVAPRAGDGDDE